MKRSSIGLLVAGAATCVLLVPALAFGAGGWHVGWGNGNCADGAPCYADADGDGVCDNWENGACPNDANGAGGYVDADGDGVCDNWGQTPRGRQQGLRTLQGLAAQAQQAPSDEAGTPDTADAAEAAETSESEAQAAADAVSVGAEWQGYCGPNCIDADGDGVCDNWENGGCPNGAGGYVDADGDGVCDNWSEGVCPGNGQGAGQGHGCGNGNGGHHGAGHGRWA